MADSSDIKLQKTKVVYLSDDYPYYPKWLRFAPFLGRPPVLTKRQWIVISLIAIATIFENYDIVLFSLALKQIQTTLSIPEESLGGLSATIRMGALPAFLFMVIADRWGRRKVLIFTIVAYTLATGATAFSQDLQTYIVLQFFARVFAVAEVLLAFVVITEELDPEHRGWGVGALAALGACGQGLACILFSFINVLPMGWRFLYLVGLFPLLIVAWLRRNMPETQRFEDQKTDRLERISIKQALIPIVNLIRMYPGRFLAIGSVIFLISFAENSASLLGPKFFQEAHGWAPWQISILTFFGGFIGICLGVFVGKLSDRIGRRPTAIIFLSLYPITVIAFYQAFGWFLPPLWIAKTFFGFAAGVVLGTFRNELFPTSYRSTASGAQMIVATFGGVLGLWAESVFYSLTGSHWTAISILALFAVIAPIIVFLFFPETSGRTLEDIAPEID